MAGFCGNCGAPLDDGARVCGQCGVPVNGVSKHVSGVHGAKQENTKKIAKKIKMVVILAVIAGLAVGAWNIASNFIGPKGLVRKAMKAYEKYDIDQLVSLSSDMYFYGGEDEAESYFGYGVGNDLDDLENSVGHSYKLTYKIKEIYDLSERRLDELLDSIEYLYPYFDVDNIKKISVASVSVTAKKGSKSVNRNIEITMTKEGKEWKILYIE